MEFEECMKIGTGLTELTEDRKLKLKKKTRLLQLKMFFSDTPSEKKIKHIIIIIIIMMMIIIIIIIKHAVPQ